MFYIDWKLLAGIVAASLLLWTWLSRRWRQWRRSQIATRRSRRAMRGEQQAELLLEREGYEILERQLSEEWLFLCDSKETSFQLRADLLVRKDDRDYIAEVKTGDKAPDLKNAATRRQLLEYALAYDSPTILLVDAERGTIHEVYFPLLSTEDESEEEQVA